MKQEIALLFGGQSPEHEVSCKSALTIMRAMDERKYNIHRIGITKDGRWLYTESEEAIENGTWKDGGVRAVMSPDAGQHGMLLIEGERCRLQKIDVVFPVLHGEYGEDGTVQGLFELAGIPYVGCGVRASAVSIDKLSTKIFADCIGVRQAAYVSDIYSEGQHIEETVKKVGEKLGYPVFVKPSNAGSSRGVSKAENETELREAILLAKKFDCRVLIEEMIVGREVECAVLSTPEPKASYVGEVLSAADFYDYDAKYNNADSKTVVNPNLSESVKEEIRDYAVKIFRGVGGFGLSRVDFFVEEKTNQVIFNEINTLPGFTNISMYPILWKAMGYEIGELIDKLIEMAGERNGSGSYC